MMESKQHSVSPALDNWKLHEDQYDEYARMQELHGGKSIHQLVAEVNTPKPSRNSKPSRRTSGRGL